MTKNGTPQLKATTVILWPNILLPPWVIEKQISTTQRKLNSNLIHLWECAIFSSLFTCAFRGQLFNVRDPVPPDWMFLKSPGHILDLTSAKSLMQCSVRTRCSKQHLLVKATLLEGTVGQRIVFHFYIICLSCSYEIIELRVALC